jgi:anti-sigma factor RsiW
MRERVSLELDGELSPYEASLLERHLRRCAACAAFASGAGRSTELLRSAPLEGAPQFTLPRRAARARFSVGAGAAVASTAAAALVAGSVLSFATPSGNRPSGVALYLVPSVVANRTDGGPLGLRHPSAVRFTASRPRLGLASFSRHGLFGS